MDSRVLVEDFRRALAQFRAALALPVAGDVLKAGCIQYFEFSFELAYSEVSIQDLASEQRLIRWLLTSVF